MGLVRTVSAYIVLFIFSTLTFTNSIFSRGKYTKFRMVLGTYSSN